jgi:hypothetical protein
VNRAENVSNRMTFGLIEENVSEHLIKAGSDEVIRDRFAQSATNHCRV